MRRVPLTALISFLALAGCAEPLTLDLPRSDSTAIQELAIIEPLQFAPGTALLTAQAEDVLKRELALAATDPGSSVRILVPPGPPAVSATRMRNLIAAITRPQPFAGWSVTPDAPNLQPDNGVLIVHRVGLPPNICQSDPNLSGELREQIAHHGCEVVAALDMNVANPRDEVAGEDPPLETAPQPGQAKLGAAKPTIRPAKNRPTRSRRGSQ